MFWKPPDLCVQPSSAVSSEKERHERLYPASVGRIFVGKVPQQERFFLLEFNPKPGAQEEKSEPGTKLAGRDGRCQAHQENARVNGVPHEPVWPGLHEFMSLFESDRAAPVAGQHPARP